MEEFNPLKTQNFFYTPKLSSFYADNIRTSLHGLNKNKNRSKNEKKIPFNIKIKNIFKKNINKNDKDTYIQNFLKNKTNVTPNRSNNNQDIKNSFKNDNSYKLNIVLPYMLNNYNKINLNNKVRIKLGLSFKNKETSKTRNIINPISKNNLNLFNSDINKIPNRENYESVEWMIYKRKKNKKNSSEEKNVNILEELYNLQKKEEYLKIKNNNANISRLIEIQKYNSYNDFKKKHNKDYLFFGKNLKKEKTNSLEIKDKKEKTNFLYENNNNIIKKRKLIKYSILSIPGSHKGMEKVNQDCSLILPNINDCKNVKLFGIFDGHGTYGDKISKEICEYFSLYFNNKSLYEKDLNYSDNKETDDSSSNEVLKIKFNINSKFQYNIKDIFSNKIEKINNQNLKEENCKIVNQRKINNINENIRNKFNQLFPNTNSKKSLVLSKFKNIKNFINDIISQKGKLKSIYNILSSNNFFHIFNSFNKIDKILHEKYTDNKICEGTGTALSILLLFNDSKIYSNIYSNNNYNKIISCNLGNTKSILITEDKLIKELNILHTPCNKEERIRIEKNGGKIDRIDWLKVGPLRVWFQDKKYPGLTITRSFGDFEAESLGILSIPDIKEYDIDEEKIKILIIGTNGIWEFLTNDKIMDIVWSFYDYEDAEGAAHKIIEIAGKMWKIKNPHNIPYLSVIVLYFK